MFNTEMSSELVVKRNSWYKKRNREVMRSHFTPDKKRQNSSELSRNSEHRVPTHIRSSEENQTGSGQVMCLFQHFFAVIAGLKCSRQVQNNNKSTGLTSKCIQRQLAQVPLLGCHCWTLEQSIINCNLLLDRNNMS